MSRTLEKRFEGNGNCWLAGNHRGWKLQCAKCGISKTVNHNYGRPLAPKALVLKFERDGWSIGNQPKDDLCPQCQRRSVLPKAKIEQCRNILTDALSPVVSVNGARIHFSELKIAAKQLPPEQAKELIALLRDQLPKHEPKAKPPKRMPEAADPEYQQWLDTLK